MKIVDISKFNSDELFFCYSPNLYKFLRYKKDIMPIGIKVNQKTHKKYSIFVKSPDLQACLDEWKNNKITGKLAIKGDVKWEKD